MTYLTRPEAAAHIVARGLPITKGSLQKLASIGGGPPYQIFGNKAVYTSVELDSWAEQRLTAPRTSTSERPAEASDTSRISRPGGRRHARTRAASNLASKSRQRKALARRSPQRHTVPGMA